jgi:aryl-alcohol dehydrogenase-like predicted oxidoreductase
MEYSLGCREIEDDVLPCARQLGVSIVAYSPLARGLLAGVHIKELDPNDWRHMVVFQFLMRNRPTIPAPHTLTQVPRHTADNMTENSVLISAVQALAQAKQCTPAQICLAWLLAQGSDVIPLVGTKTTDRITENAMAVTVNALSL